MLLERTPTKTREKWHPGRIIPPPEGQGCGDPLLTSALGPGTATLVQKSVNSAANFMVEHEWLSQKAAESAQFNMDLPGAILGGMLVALRTWDNFMYKDPSPRAWHILRESAYKACQFFTPNLMIEMTKNPESFDFLKAVIVVVGVTTALASGFRTYDNLQREPDLSKRIGYAASEVNTEPYDEITTIDRAVLQDKLITILQSNPNDRTQNKTTAVGTCPILDRGMFKAGGNLLTCPDTDKPTLNCGACKHAQISFLQTSLLIEELSEETGWTARIDNAIQNPQLITRNYTLIGGNKDNRYLSIKERDGNWVLISTKIRSPY